WNLEINAAAVAGAREMRLTTPDCGSHSGTGLGDHANPDPVMLRGARAVPRPPVCEAKHRTPQRLLGILVPAEEDAVERTGAGGRWCGCSREPNDIGPEISELAEERGDCALLVGRQRPAQEAGCDVAGEGTVLRMLDKGAVEAELGIDDAV